MAQDSTLHVKLDAETDGQLKRLAYEKGKSKGQLVREAISVCYQTALEDLPVRQQQAVSAYQGGYISLGKLARDMGLHVLAMRAWLTEHHIDQRSTFGDEDVANA
ncbi:MAG: ribbon-helix-helix protein, CopG family [Verrucomicrobia bacterium]|nr:ribbon-helix-helix protein, CopG family [Verrucomicrobiota bacterium]